MVHRGIAEDLTLCVESLFAFTPSAAASSGSLRPFRVVLSARALRVQLTEHVRRDLEGAQARVVVVHLRCDDDLVRLGAGEQALEPLAHGRGAADQRVLGHVLDARSLRR